MAFTAKHQPVGIPTVLKKCVKKSQNEMKTGITGAGSRFKHESQAMPYDSIDWHSGKSRDMTRADLWSARVSFPDG
jgi:hypothetical protein